MSSRRILLTTVVSIAVVAAVFAYAFPHLAAYRAVWGEVVHAPLAWLLALVAATVVDIFTYPLPWRAALPRLSWLDGLRMTQASTAFSLVVPGGAPLGMAVSFAMLRSAGFQGGQVAAAVAVTGIWSQVSTFLFPLVALAVLSAEGVGSSTLQLLAGIGTSIAVVVIGIIGAALWRAGAAAWLGEALARVINVMRRRAGREPTLWGADALVRQRTELLILLRHRWVSLTVTTLANQLTGYLMLEIAVRSVGIGRGQVSVGETFAAWSVGRVLGSLPITPGGIGFVELGLTGSLIGFGGPRAASIAAVLLYRVASILPTLALGSLSGITWRTRRRDGPVE